MAQPFEQWIDYSKMNIVVAEFAFTAAMRNAVDIRPNLMRTFEQESARDLGIAAYFCGNNLKGNFAFKKKAFKLQDKRTLTFDELVDHGIIKKKGLGTEDLTMPRIGVATYHLYLYKLCECKGLPVRIQESKVPACMQTPLLSSVRLTPEGLILFKDWSQKFSVLTKGKYDSEMIDRFQESSVVAFRAKEINQLLGVQILAETVPIKA